MLMLMKHCLISSVQQSQQAQASSQLQLMEEASSQLRLQLMEEEEAASVRDWGKVVGEASVGRRCSTALQPGGVRGAGELMMMLLVLVVVRVLD